MVATPAIRNLIRENKTHQIPSMIQTSAAHGMQSMDQNLRDLYMKGFVTYEEAMTRDINVEELKKIAQAGLDVSQFPDGMVTVGTGCDYCFHSGYVDRTAIYEMMPIDDVVKEQIMDRASATVIKRSAIERGLLKTLRMDGLAKVLRGQSTIDEVMRVTQLDMM